MAHGGKSSLEPKGMVNAVRMKKKRCHCYCCRVGLLRDGSDRLEFEMCWKWPPTLGHACFRVSRSLKKGKARKGTVRGRHETDCTLTANERATTSTMGMEWTRCKMFVFAGLFDLECDWMEPRPAYEFTMLQPHYSHAPLSMRSCTLVLYACRRRPAGVSDSRQIMIAKTTRGFFAGFSEE